MVVLLSHQLLFDSCVFLKPITVALDVDHLAVVKQPVEYGCGDHRIAEQLLPVGKALVRGDDRRVLFVAVADELEKQVRFFAVHGQATDLIDHHQGRGQIRLSFGLGLFELAHQRVHGRKVDLKSVVAGLVRDQKPYRENIEAPA